MPKPLKPPKPPSTEQEILQVLQLLVAVEARQNKILRNTEANNERRHKELLQVIDKLSNPDAGRIVWTKLRREKIEQ